ncbi:exopolysaccharide biosynthesis polyprenyl glycosylphosphotransferase [Bradyrhizobium sp. INPA01-394B]|uniref:Exopolysaccharide biosynthesis polyprenyl glycosylphosphotransferase n=1 Tax=Bradyrhizobium campsiandrae TaxID=1729892 RepID=A0ABR7UB30_9BRAD|nr:exopolysaccharide biosynthesis polyprenyl glycosylphosphotransferase [Bradyrhizobium campsiandrae]MBC9879339.1 exopolysaccharide biosynthesis polyprenyl glycosylphosphotransferase [Bradyrhizobium campsiandrae]MBC9980731.1 exopolysaccharide biosynthesis polyprenyl glycosylphosphotransferase [Bradyrhizobium campsiandrae]
MTDVVNSRETNAFTRGLAGTRFHVRLEAVESICALIDILTVAGAGLLGGWLYKVVLDGGGGGGDASMHAALGLGAGLAYALAAHGGGLYRTGELLKGGHEREQIWGSWCLVALALAMTVILFRAGDRALLGQLGVLFGLGGISLPPSRRMVKRCLLAALRRELVRGPRAAVIGTKDELALMSKSELLTRFGWDEVRRFSLPSDGSCEIPEIMRDEIVTWLRSAAVEEVVLALPWSRPRHIQHALAALRVLPLPVHLLPDSSLSRLLDGQTAVSRRLYVLDLQRAPLTRAERVMKRMLDLTVAATALVLLSPILLMAGIAVGLNSKGPIIFRQRRAGFNGKPFVIYKLRTMKVLEDGPDVAQATKSDPRITSVGRVLRRSSIDELPQLWNVLRGHMSFVGPRPHALAHDDQYGQVIANYAYRHHVKPGMTGWAQVQGFRGETAELALMERRIMLDLWYIDNWTLLLDLWIIFATAFELVRRRNAY